jgi:hypothetical protein
MKAPGMKFISGRFPVGMNWPADTSVAAAARQRRELTFMAKKGDYVSGTLLSQDDG